MFSHTCKIKGGGGGGGGWVNPNAYRVHAQSNNFGQFTIYINASNIFEGGLSNPGATSDQIVHKMYLCYQDFFICLDDG